MVSPVGCLARGAVLVSLIAMLTRAASELNVPTRRPAIPQVRPRCVPRELFQVVTTTTELFALSSFSPPSSCPTAPSAPSAPPVLNLSFTQLGRTVEIGQEVPHRHELVRRIEITCPPHQARIDRHALALPRFLAGLGDTLAVVDRLVARVTEADLFLVGWLEFLPA